MIKIILALLALVMAVYVSISVLVHLAIRSPILFIDIVKRNYEDLTKP